MNRGHRPCRGHARSRSSTVVRPSSINAFDRFAAAEDRVFHRARHQVPPKRLPPPGTGSIIIFIESALRMRSHFDGLDSLLPWESDAK